MKNHKKFIKKCLDLAILGKGNTKTNPLVGCVIVKNNQIVASGYHKKFGQAHAEKNAIEDLQKNYPKNYKNILKEATLYVNLEPCSHYGKTPPCANLIIKYKIKKVVIGTLDPNKKVNGKGYRKLKEKTDVIIGVLEKECEEINAKYFINHRLKRPFIILKWAESKDKFINTNSKGITQISGQKSITLSHKWRSQVDAIMVGTNTITCDNPKLTTRYFSGKNPTRITIDRKNKLNEKSKWNIFNNHAKTIILNESKNKITKNIQYLNYQTNKTIQKMNESKKLVHIMKMLYENQVRSILIEGGTIIIQKLIEENLWDEARIFTSNKKLLSGKKGPLLDYQKLITKTKKIENDRLVFIQNKRSL